MPELSIVVSALNEEKNVTNLLQRLVAVLDNQKIKGEIIFLNNHSTDKTGEIADTFARKDKRVRVIHRHNRPSKDLGSSLREGFAAAKGCYLIIMDADLSHDPADLARLFSHRKDADIIIGSRFERGGSGDMQFSRVLISRFYNITARLVAGRSVKDFTTGFKLYRKEVLDSLKLTNDGFGLHMEILLKSIRKGFTTKEIPIHYHSREDGESKLSYRKQFKTYALPLLQILKQRIKPW